MEELGEDGALLGKVISLEEFRCALHHLGWPAAHGESGSTKAWAAGLCTELKTPHESRCILCADFVTISAEWLLLL